MKNNKMLIVSSAIVFILLIGSTMVSASDSAEVQTNVSSNANDSAEISAPPEVSGINVFIPADEADEYIDELYRLQGLENPWVSRVPIEELPLGPFQEPFYNFYYAKADEQQEKLNKIIDDTSLGLIGTWTRDVLIVMGELPVDMPRLTLQEAEKFMESYDPASSISPEETFNEIAGAPDWEGGSGMRRAVYFLDDERRQAIYVFGEGVVHVVPDGQKASIIINGSENKNVVPSAAPQH